MTIMEQYHAASRMKEGLRNGTYADEGPSGEAFACSCFVCGELVFHKDAIELMGEGVDRWGKAWKMPFKVHSECSLCVE